MRTNEFEEECTMGSEDTLHTDGSLRIRTTASFRALVLYECGIQALRERSCALMDDVHSITIRLAQHFHAGAR